MPIYSLIFLYKLIVHNNKEDKYIHHSFLTMGNIQTSIVLFMLLCGVFSQANAGLPTTSYVRLARLYEPCKPGDPKCKPAKSETPYQRGCLKQNHCRDEFSGRKLKWLGYARFGLLCKSTWHCIIHEFMWLIRLCFELLCTLVRSSEPYHYFKERSHMFVLIHIRDSLSFW